MACHLHLPGTHSAEYLRAFAADLQGSLFVYLCPVGSSSSNLSSCVLDSGESWGSHSVSPPCAIDWIPSQGENLGAMFGLPSFVSHLSGIAVICCLVYCVLDTVVLRNLSGEFFLFWLFQMKGNLVFFLCWLEAEFQIIRFVVVVSIVQMSQHFKNHFLYWQTFRFLLDSKHFWSFPLFQKWLLLFGPKS